MPKPSPRPRRRPLGVVVAALVGLFTLVLAPVAAHAAGYQFWGYYQLTDGEWGFANEGAGTTVPEDGAVEGWRFAVAADDDTRFPRATPSFDDVCAAAPEAGEGEKRVAVVVDFGRDVDAPEGETPPEPTAACVTAPEASTGQQLVTLLVEDVRTDPSSGLICGLGGFPSAGCGDPVEEPTEDQLAPDEPIEIAVGAPVGGGTGETDGPETTGGEDATDGGDDAGEDTPAETTDATTDDTDEAEEGATGGEDATDGDEAGSEDADTESGDVAGDPGDEGDGPTQDVAEDGNGGMPIWAWLLVGLVVIGALLGAVVGATRRRDQEREAGVDPDI